MKKLFLLLLLSTSAWASYSPQTIITDPVTPANKATVSAGGALKTDASGSTAPKTYPNSAGSFVLNSSLTTVVTESAPANAVGFVLQAKDSNAANIRWAVGATATTTSGMQLQPGRDTGFIPVGANVSVVAESGTLEYQLTWVKQ